MIDFNDIQLWQLNQKLEKYNFKTNVKIECYDLSNKKEAINIIRNNDFLQYHYFSQDYGPVKAASYIYLFYLTYNNIKMYVGFASIAAPTLAKKLRRRYFGKAFLETVYDKSKKENGFIKDKTYVMSRIVLLPSYRGLGLSRYLLEHITKDMSTKSFYFEMLSNMFHNYYFAGYEFNTTFIDTKKYLSKEEYNDYFLAEGTTKDLSGKSQGPKGFKGDTKYLANLVFNFNKNDFFKELILNKYGLELDWNTKYEINKEKLLWSEENEVPLLLLEYYNFDYIKKHKDEILQKEKDYIANIKMEDLDIEEGDDELW